MERSDENINIKEKAEIRLSDSNGILLYQSPEDSTSVVDVVLILVRNLRLIGLAAAIGAAIGVVVILVPEKEHYTATATVIREGQSDSRVGSPLMSLNRLGLNLGGSGTGLTADVYPEILTSREVRYAVVRDTFWIQGASVTLAEYLDQPPGWWERFSASIKAYTIGLPATLQKRLDRERNITPGPPQPVGTSTNGVVSSEGGIDDSFQAGPRVEKAMSNVNKLISTSIDAETGLMRISVTADEPRLSVDLVRSFLSHFQHRVRDIQTEKARQDVEFVRQRFDQAAGELAAAEEELAAFLDRNQSAQSARLLTERERLQRQVEFKASLYSELQTQLAQSELNLQSSSPVITLLEAPAMPTSPAGSNPTFVLVVTIILGTLFGVALAMGRTYLEKSREAEEKYKIEEIAAILGNTRVGRFIRRSKSKAE